MSYSIWVNVLWFICNTYICHISSAKNWNKTDIQKTYILSELPFSGPVLSPDVTFTQHSNVSHEKWIYIVLQSKEKPWLKSPIPSQPPKVSMCVWSVWKFPHLLVPLGSSTSLRKRVSELRRSPWMQWHDTTPERRCTVGNSWRWCHTVDGCVKTSWGYTGFHTCQVIGQISEPSTVNIR